MEWFIEPLDFLFSLYNTYIYVSVWISVEYHYLIHTIDVVFDTIGHDILIDQLQIYTGIQGRV